MQDPRAGRRSVGAAWVAGPDRYLIGVEAALGQVTASSASAGSRSWNPCLYIVSNLVDGLATLRQDIGKERPDMDHLLPDVELNLHARVCRLGREPAGVIEQRFVRSNQDQYGR